MAGLMKALGRPLRRGRGQNNIVRGPLAAAGSLPCRSTAVWWFATRFGVRPSTGRCVPAKADEVGHVLSSQPALFSVEAEFWLGRAMPQQTEKGRATMLLRHQP